MPFCIILFGKIENTFALNPTKKPAERRGFSVESERFSDRRHGAVGRTDRTETAATKHNAAHPYKPRGAAQDGYGKRLFCGIELHIVAARPQLFQAVEHAGVVVEYVHDYAAKVDDRPFAFRNAVGAQHFRALLFQLFADIFGKGFHLFVAPCRADDEIVGNDRKVGHLEHGNVHGFSVVEFATYDILYLLGSERDACGRVFHLFSFCAALRRGFPLHITALRCGALAALVVCAFCPTSTPRRAAPPAPPSYHAHPAISGR